MAAHRSRSQQTDLGAREALRGLATTAGATTAVAALAAWLAPPDAVQGQWQRLMYLHVPSAWLAYLCYAVVLVSGAAFLRRPSLAAERWGRAAAEVGVVSTIVTLVVGSVWGRAVWGVWWTWDARLVSTAAMLLIYVAYLALGRLPGERLTVQRRTAILGCAGFLIVPVVHFSVVWWTTLHQQATVLSPKGVPPIDPRMAVALSLAVVAMTTVGLAAMVWRVHVPALRSLAADSVPSRGPGSDVPSERLTAAADPGSGQSAAPAEVAAP